MCESTAEKITLESLAKTVRQLQKRIEDMKDLFELRDAIESDARRCGIPWEKAKAELEID